MLSFLTFISLALYHTSSQTLNCTWINGVSCNFACGDLNGEDCIGSTINCLSCLNCNVDCYGPPARRRNLLSSYSCSGDGDGCCDSVINCAPSKTCRIDCRSGCSNLTVNAIEATSLSITGCYSYSYGANTCAFMNIYCPRNGRGGTTDICQLEGSPNTQIEHTNIYTEEGLNDLKISTVKTIGTRIFCGKTSGFSCILNANGDGCDSGQPTICENYISPTSEPTLEPTSYPSSYPTEPTLEPTSYPSLYPTETSVYQTLYPSLYPTKAETTTSRANTDSFVENKGRNDIDSTLLIIIGILILSFIIVVFVAVSLFYCYKPWKKQNIKPNPDKNINNVEIVKMDDEDIVTAINRTDIGFVGTSDGDYDIVAAINRTNIGNSDEYAMKLMNIIDTNDGNTDEGDKQAMDVNDVSAVHEGVNYNLDEDGAKEVNIWLKSMGFLMYYDTFMQNGFDSMESIQEITDKNVFNDIGITLIGHQLKLMKYIKKSKAT